MISVVVTAGMNPGQPLQKLTQQLLEGDGELLVGIPKSLRQRRGGRGTVPLWVLALWLEVGVPTNILFGSKAPIPARPALAASWYRNQDTYARSLRGRVQAIKDGRVKPEKTMAALGQKIVRDIQMAYEFWSTPPNKPFTIENKGRKGYPGKGFDDPLIGATRMLQSAWTWEWREDKSPVKRQRRNALVAQAARVEKGWDFRGRRIG